MEDDEEEGLLELLLEENFPAAPTEPITTPTTARTATTPSTFCSEKTKMRIQKKLKTFRSGGVSMKILFEVFLLPRIDQWSFQSYRGGHVHC